MPEFPPTLLPQLLAAETSSRASNAEYLTFYSKNPLLIDRLRFVRESYKNIFTELLLADDTRVGFHRQDNGLLVWQGAYLTRSAETLLSWRAVANALNDLIEQHELIAAIDPKKLPQAEEQLSFELPDGSPTSAEDDRLEKDDFLTPEKQETVIRSALPVAEYNAPQMDDGSVITDEEINLALAAGSNFENSKFRIYQQFTTTQGDHAAFLKKEYGSGGRSWDYQSGAHGWVDHGPAGLKLILTNEEGRFERRLLWRAAAKRIAYLIEMQRFLTPQELEQYPTWAAEQREVASVVRDEPGNVPDTEAKKAELFGKVRSGAVRVLMGSTQKMGAGTNVQTRLCALHHLDCPWRPADIAQRNGRMVRQGNMNKEVSIFIYITEATFDAYSYQLVENKQKFISQIMTSKSPARSCEDLDEAALSYAEVKALAAGNPMIKEKMDLDIQVARLRTLKAAYNSQHYRLEDAVTGIFLREIRGTECRIQAFEKDMQTAKDSQSYDKDGKLVFSIELDGTSYDKREDAGKALLGLVGAAVRADHHVLVGHYAGFEVTVAYVPLSKVFVAHLVGQATHTTELGSDAAGNMVRLQNVVAALPQEVSGLRNNLQQLRVQLDSAKEELQQPFLQEQELNDKSARLAELDALLNVGNDAPVLEGEAEVVNEDDSVRTPREENELER